MAIFGFGKKEEGKEVAPQESAKTSTPATKAAKKPAAKPAAKKVAAKKPEAAVSSRVTLGSEHVLRNPRITEKATMSAAESVYVFDVATSATKKDITRAFATVYKVTPRMVRVASIPSKVRRNSRTGRVGVKQGGKKAYIYLAKGETIAIT